MSEMQAFSLIVLLSFYGMLREGPYWENLKAQMDEEIEIMEAKRKKEMEAKAKEESEKKEKKKGDDQDKGG
jgi:hypothetical protein